MSLSDIKASKAAGAKVVSPSSPSQSQSKGRADASKEGAKSFSSLVNLFGSIIGTSRAGSSFIPDFSSRSRDREAEAEPRPRETDGDQDLSRRDLGARERESREDVEARARDRADDRGQDRRDREDKDEVSSRGREEESAPRESSRGDRRPVEEGDRGRGEDSSRGMEGEQKGLGEDRGSLKDSEGQDKVQAGASSGESRSEGKSVDSSSPQEGKEESSTPLALKGVGEGDVDQVGDSLPSAIVDVLRILLLSSDLLAELAKGNVEGKDVEVLPDAGVINVIDNLLTTDEKTALTEFLVEFMGGKEEGSGDEKGQGLKEGVSQNDILRALVSKAQSPEGETLRSAVNKILSFDMKKANVEFQGVRQDFGSVGSDEGVDIDGDLLEKLRVALARIIQGGQGKVDNLDRQGYAGEGKDVDVEVKKAGSEGVMRVNPLDSDLLSKLQEGKDSGLKKQVLDMPEDVRLRAQKVFVEADSGKAEKTISRVAENLLSQFVVDGALSRRSRGEAGLSLERFAQAGAVKSANAKAGGEQLLKVNVEAKGQRQDLLWESRMSERGGKKESGGQNVRGKEGDVSLLGSQSGDRSDKSGSAQKDSRLGQQALASRVREQIQMNFQKAVNTGQDRIRLQLSPQELGRLDVRITIGKDGSLTARIFVERQETLDLLRSDARSLLEALKEGGLKAGGDSLEFSLQNSERDFSGDGKKKKGSDGSLAGVEGLGSGEEVGAEDVSRALGDGGEEDEREDVSVGDGEGDDEGSKRLDVVV